MKNTIKIFLLALIVSSCANLKEVNKTMLQLKSQNENLERKLKSSNELALDLRKQISNVDEIINQNNKLKVQISNSKKLIEGMQLKIIEAKKVQSELNRLSNAKKLKSLSITDYSGIDRIRLFIDHEGVPRIRIYDENSDPTVSLFSYPLSSRGKGAAGFAVVNDKEEPLVWLGNNPKRSRYLAFRSENTNSNSLFLGNDFINKSSYMAVLDANSKMRLFNGLNHKANTSSLIVNSANLNSNFEVSAFGDGRILRRMQDSNRRLRQANIIDGNNNLYEMHYDYKGNLKQGLYIPLNDSKFQNYSYKKPGAQLWEWFSNIMTARSLFR